MQINTMLIFTSVLVAMGEVVNMAANKLNKVMMVTAMRSSVDIKVLC